MIMCGELCSFFPRFAQDQPLVSMRRSIFQGGSAGEWRKCFRSLFTTSETNLFLLLIFNERILNIQLYNKLFVFVNWQEIKSYFF